jgi:hypothetical protein
VLTQSQWHDINRKIRLMQIYALDHTPEQQLSTASADGHTSGSTSGSTAAWGDHHDLPPHDYSTAEHNYYLTTLESAVHYLLSVDQQHLPQLSEALTSAN